ncbi:H-NS family nucleoid-associated regulatory protein [Caballeronia sp. BR00000012568055]|uniref:H-NS family nucleoid-associated regulatory protein n=1 Tax=Caballeronia sp. BR00000012568055 TaxID=2918761 RepID=UPI0023F68015|nr:H-NS family nucleoid-associated regulatory protein [Caballeronia sp. BR00000012568055]
MATIGQIRAKIQALQKQADTLIAKQAQKVVDHIRDLMIEHGLTTADIEAAAKKRRQKALGVSSVAAKKRAVKNQLPPKYRNPKTGDTWSGRARPPAWIANARDRSKFLIDATDVTGTSKPKAAAAKSAPGKPLYRDPETGKTWTGHGRAPAWIADAADRSVFAIGASAEAKSKSKVAKAGKTTAPKKRARPPKPAIAEPVAEATEADQSPAK